MTYKYVEISSALRAEGFDEQFVRVVMKVAEDYDGLQDLLTIWINEEDPFDRIKTMDDIKTAVKDCLVSETNSPERTCEKCGATGAVHDLLGAWRCTQCSNKWASSLWITTPRAIKRCFPGWHKHQLRIEGFPADYIQQVIYLSRNFASMRELLERWINEGSSEKGCRTMLAIDDLLRELSKKAVQPTAEHPDGT